MSRSSVDLELSGDIARFVDNQYRNAYWLIDAARYPSGLYADAYLPFEGGPGPMGSIAATGVGIVGLTIAYLEGWDADALRKLRQTLELVTHEPADRNGPVARDPESGFFYHFFDGRTGAAWPRSEISTIDTAILVAGALFAARQIGHEYPDIAERATKLLHSVDWRLAITPAGDAINMCIENGKGVRPNRPFSEYAIVAHLAQRANPGEAGAAWRNVYAPERLERLLYVEYRGLRLFGQVHADGRAHYLSSFVCQFPMYLIPAYAESEIYWHIVRDHCLADRLSWLEGGTTPSYVWGHGAGSNDGLPSARSAGTAPVKKTTCSSCPGSRVT